MAENCIRFITQQVVYSLSNEPAHSTERQKRKCFLGNHEYSYICSISRRCLQGRHFYVRSRVSWKRVVTTNSFWHYCSDRRQARMFYTDDQKRSERVEVISLDLLYYTISWTPLHIACERLINVYASLCTRLLNSHRRTPECQQCCRQPFLSLCAP